MVDLKMIQSRIMHFYIKLTICIFFLGKHVDTQVDIPAVTNPINGDTVNLTCIISAFTLPAVWKNNDNGAHITTCFSNKVCSPSSDGIRYNFSATASSIIVTISRFNLTIDTFTWKCEYSGIVAVYRIMAANTGIITTAPNTAVTTAVNTMVTTDPNTAVTPAPSTTVTTAANTTVTTAANTMVTPIPNTAVTTAANTTATPIPNTAVTTATNKTASKTVMTIPVTSSQSQNALIIGITVGGFVFILIMIIIICFCCRKYFKQNNDNQDEMKKKQRQKMEA